VTVKNWLTHLAIVNKQKYSLGSAENIVYYLAKVEKHAKIKRENFRQQGRSDYKNNKNLYSATQHPAVKKLVCCERSFLSFSAFNSNVRSFGAWYVLRAAISCFTPRAAALSPWSSQHTQHYFSGELSEIFCSI
jgi:hypothetical protein